MKGLALKRDNIKNIQNILLNMVENNRYMDSKELKANLKVVDNMMDDLPERDDKMYSRVLNRNSYYQQTQTNPLLSTKRMDGKPNQMGNTGGSDAPSWFRQLTEKKKR